jgi:F0F1-type ATP synthase membrane subunit c/vacuolar-type H+-ATPase subunit K
MHSLTMPRERVFTGTRERAEAAEAARASWTAAHKADLKRQMVIAVVLIAFTVIYSVVVAFI